jgi:hypothetical protein
MSATIEELREAMQLAILEHPAVFGLHPSEVNPLRIYLQRRMDRNESAPAETIWRECFEQALEAVEQKFLAVIGSFSAVKDELTAELAAEPPAGAQPKPAPMPETLRKRAGSNGKLAATKARRNTSPQREASVTPRQIKYYGYLCHQAGEVPDYTNFSQLTLNQASARIKALGGK